MSRIAPLLIATGLALGTGCGAPESDPSAMPPEVSADKMQTSETLATIAISGANQTQAAPSINDAAHDGMAADRQRNLQSNDAIFSTTKLLDNPFGIGNDIFKGPFDEDVSAIYNVISEQFLNVLRTKVASGEASSQWLPVRDAPNLQPQMFASRLQRGDITTTIQVKQDQSVNYSTDVPPTKAESITITMSGPDGSIVGYIFLNSAYAMETKSDAVNTRQYTAGIQDGHAVASRYVGPNDYSGETVETFDGVLPVANVFVDAGSEALKVFV